MLKLDENNYCCPQKIVIIVARKRLEINILTRHKLPDPPPLSPAESNGRPLNFVVNVCFVCRIAWGVLRGVLGEYAALY